MMKKILGSLAIIFSILLIILGILFLIASGKGVNRFVIGLVMLVIAFFVFIVGMKLIKGVPVVLSPENLRFEIINLAKKFNGEIFLSQLYSMFGKDSNFLLIIDQLVSEGVAEEILKDGGKVYLFKDFQSTMLIKKCPYCGNDYPVRDDVEVCPTCGGDLKMLKNKVQSNDNFSLDE